MKKAVAAFAIALLLIVSGCSQDASQADSTSLAKTDVSSSKDSGKTIAERYEEFSSFSKRIDDTRNALVSLMSDADDPASIDEATVRRDVGLVNFRCDELIELGDPPADLTQIHDEIVAAAEAYKEAGQYIGAALMESSEDAEAASHVLKVGADYLKKGNEHFDRANALLEN